MAFMQPEALDKQEWVELETNNGTSWIPFDVLSKSEAASARQGDFEPLVKYSEGTRVYNDRSRIMKGYGVRLSAPGYLDSTEWEVYGSKKEALKRARELGREAEGEDYATKKRAQSRSHATTKKPHKNGGVEKLLSSDVEDLYWTGDLDRSDVARWIEQVRLDSGRVYEPIYQPRRVRGKLGESLWLKRREEHEDASRVHATIKKTPAQLDREINAALASSSSSRDARDLLATRAQRNKRK